MSDHEKIGYEKSDIDVLKVFLGGFLPSILIVISIVALSYIYSAVQIREYDRKGYADTTQIQGIRAKDEAVLSSYGRSEYSKSKYQIPIQRAMTLLLEENRSK